MITMTRTGAAAAILLVVSSCRAACPPGGTPDSPFIAHVDSSLGRLSAMHKDIRGMHPLLASLHPVAVINGDSLYIFDTDSAGESYTFRQSAPLPFPMQKGIRASFPLSSYGNRPACVVSPEVFDSQEGYVTIFHEFVHCGQALSCETSLKQSLHIARTAMAAKEYSWEINHAFPYGDSSFIDAYSRLLQSLREGDRKALFGAARDLKMRLAQDDYEYMVWEEWKEGLARYFENRIRRTYTLAPNLGGAVRPYDRVSFYAGGEGLIAHIVEHEGHALTDPEQLFRDMFGLPEAR